nr:hypothetical protein [Burkholderia gladioli]
MKRSPDTISMRSSGCASRIAASTGASTIALNSTEAATRKVPRSVSAAGLTEDTASSASSARRRAASKKEAPASVTWMRRVVRAIRVVPSSSSSRCTCLPTAVLPMPSRSAARVSEPVSTTAM